MVDQILIVEQSEENTENLNNKTDEKPPKTKRRSKTKNSVDHTSSNNRAKETSASRTSSTLRSIFKNIPIVDINADSLTRKSVSIDGQVYKTIKHMKNTMSRQSHGRFTFNMVIQSLLQDHVDLQNLRSELTLIKKEMEETQDYLKEMLKLALTNSKPQVQYIPVSGQPRAVPPPPAPPRGPPKKINYKAPNTGNLMKDYVKEIKQLFRGEILLPSSVVNITKVKHKDSKVKELEEDCLVPDIELVSVAKNFKPIVEEESNV
jgi:hypothetical protein